MKQNPILTEKEDHDNPLGMLTNLFDVVRCRADGGSRDALQYERDIFQR